MFNNMLMGAAGESIKATSFSVGNSMVVDDASAQGLTLTYSSAGDSNKTFTISCWFKIANLSLSNARTLWCFDVSGSGQTLMELESDDTLRILMEDTSNAVQIDWNTTQLFRDPHAWYHAVWTVNTVPSTPISKLFINGSEVTSFTKTTDSLAQNDTFNIGSTANVRAAVGIRTSLSVQRFTGYISEMVYLDNTVVSDATDFGEYDSNGVWRPVDVSGLTFGTSGFYLPFTSSTLLGEDYGNGKGLVDRTSGTLTGDFTQNGGNAAAFDGNYAQDNSAAARKGGGTSTAFLMKDWGSSVTKTITGFRVFGCTNQGFHSDHNTDTVEVKLQGSANGTDFTDLGTLSFTDPGNASPQGKFTGITTSTAYRYHRLLFSFDDAVGGKLCGEAEFYEGESPSGGNNLSASNAPTQSDGSSTNNYAVMTPLSSPSGVTFSNGNLQTEATSNWYGSFGSIALTSGKWYWEVDVGSATPGFAIGVADAGTMGNQTDASRLNGWTYAYDADKKFDHSSTGSSYAAPSTPSANDVFMVALDMDNGEIYVGQNGTWLQSSNPATATSPMFANLLSSGTGRVVPAFDQNTASNAAYHNFGGGPSPNSGGNADANGYGDFDYAPPSGFLAINTANLFSSAAPTIEDGTAYFQPTTYEGNGEDVATSTGKVVNQSGNSKFKPDFVWIKNRDQGDNHMLYDAVRGETKDLHSNSNAAEDTDTEGLSTFDSDGFTVGNNVEVNTDTENYVAWQWYGNNTSGGSTNDDGNIDSTVNVNTTAGFVVGEYTTPSGSAAVRTVGHGLGGALDMLFIKNQATGHWAVWHTSIGDKYLRLNAPDKAESGGTMWNSVLPSANDDTFTIGTNSDVNGDAATFTFYGFREIPGYSAFSSYTGNGDPNGPLIPLDFTPSFFFQKRTDTGSTAWHVYDTTRKTYNYNDTRLFPGSTSQEYSNGEGILDIISNGVKIRDDESWFNASSGTFMYMAFAEFPFAGTTPATAR